MSRKLWRCQERLQGKTRAQECRGRNQRTSTQSGKTLQTVADPKASNLLLPSVLKKEPLVSFLLLVLMHLGGLTQASFHVTALKTMIGHGGALVTAEMIRNRVLGAWGGDTSGGSSGGSAGASAMRSSIQRGNSSQKLCRPQMRGGNRRQNGRVMRAHHRTV